MLKNKENYIIKTTFNFGYSCTQNAPKYIPQLIINFAKFTWTLLCILVGVTMTIRIVKITIMHVCDSQLCYIVLHDACI